MIVEGQTEQAAIEMYADIKPGGLDLDRLDCAVIEAGGKEGIPLIVRVARALGVPFVVVFDTDSDKTESGSFVVIFGEEGRVEARSVPRECPLQSFDEPHGLRRVQLPLAV